jgi:hypothetical protein
MKHKPVRVQQAQVPCVESPGRSVATVLLFLGLCVIYVLVQKLRWRGLASDPALGRRRPGS